MGWLTNAVKSDILSDKFSKYIENVSWTYGIQNAIKLQLNILNFCDCKPSGANIIFCVGDGTYFMQPLLTSNGRR